MYNPQRNQQQYKTNLKKLGNHLTLRYNMSIILSHQLCTIYNVTMKQQISCKYLPNIYYYKFRQVISKESLNLCDRIKLYI